MCGGFFFPLSPDIQWLTVKKKNAFKRGVNEKHSSSFFLFLSVAGYFFWTVWRSTSRLGRCFSFRSVQLSIKNNMWMTLSSVTFRLKVCVFVSMRRPCAQLLHRTLLSLSLTKPSSVRSHVLSAWIVWLIKWGLINTKAHINDFIATVFVFCFRI